MRNTILLLITSLLVVAGCKKKDDFNLVVESASFANGVEIFDNGVAGISLQLRDAADGFGKAVTLTVEGLPPQVTTKINPESGFIVTDAGVNVYVSFVSKKAMLDAVYPVTLKFAWEGGSTSREVKLRVVQYNAAKALVGKYRAQGCDTNSNGSAYESTLSLDTGINRIRIRNFGNLGDDVTVSAIIDSNSKKITVSQQTVRDITVQGEGSYGQAFMNISCTFISPRRNNFCGMQLQRVVE